MKGRSLSLVLFVLTAVLLLGPVVFALSSHNWNIEEAVVPRDEEMRSIERSMMDIQDPGNFDIIEEDMDHGTGSFDIYMEFDSSVDFDVFLNEFRGEVHTNGENMCDLSLAEKPVFFEGGEKTSFKITGNLDRGTVEPNQPDILPHGAYDDNYNMEFVNVSVEIEMLGMTLYFEGIQGGGFV